MSVLITRFDYDKDGRVFVTGPWFGQDVYSHTTDRDKASRFERSEAERLVAEGHWRDPRIEVAS